MRADNHRGGGMPPPHGWLNGFIVTPASASRPTMPSQTGTSGSRLRPPLASAPQHRNYPQEYPLPLVPRQQPVEQPMPAFHDLARHQEDRVDEPFELHPQQLALLRAMRLLVPW